MTLVKNDFENCAFATLTILILNKKYYFLMAWFKDSITTSHHKGRITPPPIPAANYG